MVLVVRELAKANGDGKGRREKGKERDFRESLQGLIVKDRDIYPPGGLGCLVASADAHAYEATTAPLGCYF